jgi:ATP-dependent Clp protease ATP-binding subunit ClpB
MSEYQERHSVSRLVGAPPGYVGYDESGQLTEAVRRKPYSVVLLDEIEKAHPDVFNVLLQVLDDGRLTDNKGRVVDFKNTIIIMTSNIGSHLIQESINSDGEIDNKASAQVNEKVMNILKQTIRPEFLNRVDEIIFFTPLNKNQIRNIVKMQFAGIVSMFERQDLQLSITEAAVDLIVKTGFDPIYGARPIKRTIQKDILNELSKMILSDKLSKDKKIIIDANEDEFMFRN